MLPFPAGSLIYVTEVGADEISPSWNAFHGKHYSQTKSRTVDEKLAHLRRSGESAAKCFLKRTSGRRRHLVHKNSQLSCVGCQSSVSYLNVMYLQEALVTLEKRMKIKLGVLHETEIISRDFGKCDNLVSKKVNHAQELEKTHCRL